MDVTGRRYCHNKAEDHQAKYSDDFQGDLRKTEKRDNHVYSLDHNNDAIKAHEYMEDQQELDQQLSIDDFKVKIEKEYITNGSTSRRSTE